MKYNRVTVLPFLLTPVVVNQPLRELFGALYRSPRFELLNVRRVVCLSVEQRSISQLSQIKNFEKTSCDFVNTVKDIDVIQRSLSSQLL